MSDLVYPKRSTGEHTLNAIASGWIVVWIGVIAESRERVELWLLLRVERLYRASYLLPNRAKLCVAEVA